MSAESISRWQQIPLNRAADSSLLKRPREDDNESEDEMSIVSRSPSPAENMAIDSENNIYKYDEHVGGYSREVVTVDTRLTASNKGFAMLAKLGWSEGQPLGLSGDGRVDPIPLPMKSDSTGIGKISQDVEMIETTVQQRRGLDSERQQRETEEQRQAREDAVSKQAALQDQISNVLKAFYCSLCDKQFMNVSQYDEHTNSYAHHHKARAKDMQASIRLQAQDEIEKRKEKERKREEKELRKIAKANGIKVGKSLAATQVTGEMKDRPPSDHALPTAEGSSSGWSKLQPPPQPQNAPLLSSSGWSSVSPANADEKSLVPPPPALSPVPIPSQPDAPVPAILSEAIPPPPPVMAETRPSKAHASRVGWQSFQKGKRR